MDPKKPSSSSTGKMKFVPKPPKRRPAAAPSQPARNAAADDYDQDAELELLQTRLRNKQRPRHHADEKKSSVRVAFGGLVEAPMTAITTATTASQPGIVIRESGKTTILRKTVNDSSSDEAPAPTIVDSSSDEEAQEVPWDYDGTYYPTTLPMRKPRSEYLGMLDEDELGQASSNKVLKEKIDNDAEELGLLDGSEQKSYILFELPRPLPISKDSVQSSSSDPIGQAAARSSDWGKLAEGHMGKLLVYKSGAVKLKLGEVVFNVSPGTGKPCEQAVVMNIKAKECCLLGQIKKRAVVGLDVDSTLGSSTEK